MAKVIPLCDARRKKEKEDVWAKVIKPIDIAALMNRMEAEKKREKRDSTDASQERRTEDDTDGDRGDASEFGSQESNLGVLLLLRGKRDQVRGRT